MLFSWIPRLFHALRRPYVIWLMLLLFTALFAVYSSHSHYRQIHSQAEMTALETAHTHVLLTQALLVDLDRLIQEAGQRFFANTHTVDERDLIREILKQRKDTNPMIMELLILDAQGQIVNWSGNRPMPDVRMRDYYRHHLENRTYRAFVTPPQISLVYDNAWFFGLSRPVRDECGTLLGVGVAIIHIQAWQDHLQALLRGGHLSVALIHQNGKLIARAPTRPVEIGTDLSALLHNLLPLHTLVTQKIPQALDGGQRMVAFKPIEDFDLLIAAGVQLDEELAVWRQYTAGLTLFWLIFNLLAGLVAYRLHRAFMDERRTQTLYQSLFSSVSDAIFLLQVDDQGQTFRYLACNVTYAQSLGKAAHEINRQPLQAVLTPRQAASLRTYCQRCVKQQRPVSYEETQPVGDAERISMIVLNPVADPQGAVGMILGVARDMTERFTYQRRLENITHNIPGFVYQMQLDTRGQLHCQYISEGVQRLLGISPAQVMADVKQLIAAIDATEREQVLKEGLATADTLHTWHGVFRMQHRDGHSLWIEANDSPQPQADGSTIWTGYAQDVTQRKALEAALKDSEATFRAFVENANDIIFSVNPDGVLTYVSPNWTEMLGHATGEVIDQHIDRFIHPEDLPRCIAFLQRVLRTGQKQGGIEYRVRHQDGQWCWHLANASPRFDPQGQIIGLQGIARDISARKQMEAQLNHIASHDALTGLPNRSFFTERLEYALNLAKRQQKRVALMFVDLDRFKPINDTHGHAVGDVVLQVVARRMQNTLRQADTVGRIGGDEFVILLHQVNRLTDACLTAEKIRQQLELPIAYEDLQLHLSCSIGLALYPDHAQDSTTLFRQADQAMYAAKHQGRNQVCHA